MRSASLGLRSPVGVSDVGHWSERRILTPIRIAARFDLTIRARFGSRGSPQM